MIESIFISDYSKRLLFGGHPILAELGYTKSIELAIENQKMGTCDNTSYPITYLKASRIAHLRVNDIILNIIYNGIDNFQAAKFLLDLKNHIENKIMRLNKKSIKKYYFIILELLQTSKIDFSAYTPCSYVSDKILIDVVQNIHCIMAGERAISNTSHGEIFSDRLGFDSLVITLEKSEHVVVKSIHRVQTDGNKLKVSCENPENRNLVSFYQKNASVLYFKMKRLDNLITIESEYKGIFKYIEFVIPVGIHTYKIMPQMSNGKCDFDIKTGILYWRFKDVAFHKETVKFNISTLEANENIIPITVNFRIEDSNACVLKLISTVNKSCPSQQFWMRSITQNGYYELNAD